MSRERAQRFAPATLRTLSLAPDNRTRRRVFLRFNTEVADVEGNRADTLVQLARYCGLSHATSKHFPDALPEFGFGKMMRVGHVRSVSHGRREKDAARSARSQS